MASLVISKLIRDISKKESYVNLVWENYPERHLGLEIPYDCTVENLKSETEKSLRAFAKELESATVQEVADLRSSDSEGRRAPILPW